jgi:hypothetical protein
VNAADFRRVALSLEGAEEGSHRGATDFRVGGRIFATLAAINQGYGNVMLTPEQQAEFVAEDPSVFIPVPGGWGRNGATHIRLDLANKDVLAGALEAAWRLRIQKNQEAGRSKRASSAGGGSAPAKRKRVDASAAAEPRLTRTPLDDAQRHGGQPKGHNRARSSAEPE